MCRVEAGLEQYFEELRCHNILIAVGEGYLLSQLYFYGPKFQIRRTEWDLQSVYEIPCP